MFGWSLGPTETEPHGLAVKSAGDRGSPKRITATAPLYESAHHLDLPVASNHQLETGRHIDLEVMLI